MSRNNKRWSPEHDALLGTMTDTALAEKLGFHQSTVSVRRNLLGIPAHPDGRRHGGRENAVEWSPSMVALLGTMSDAKVAARLGLSIDTVARKRREAGIVNPLAPRNKWRPEWDRLLGTKPDGTLAAELGVVIQTVHIRRRRAGVAPFGKSCPVPSTWKEEWNVLLGTKPDVDLARDLGVSVRTVTNKRWFSGIKPCAVRRGGRPTGLTKRLRAMPDEELSRPTKVIANDLGCSPQLVYIERRRRGLEVPRAAGSGMPPDFFLRAAVAGMLAASESVRLIDIARVLKVTPERARQLVEGVRGALLFAASSSVTASDPESIAGEVGHA